MHTLRLPSPSMTVAIIALVIALGGTSYAALKLPANSVRSTTIRNGQVKSVDLAKGSVTASKVRDGSLRTADFGNGQIPAGAPGAPGTAGAEGPRGLQGAPGLAGLSGVSHVRTVRQPAEVNISFSQLNGAQQTYTLTLQLPAGSHLLLAKARVRNDFSGVPGDVNCSIRDPANNDLDGTGFFRVAGNAAGFQIITLQAPVTLAAAGTVRLFCRNSSPSQEFKLSTSTLTAIEADAIDAFAGP